MHFTLTINPSGRGAVAVVEGHTGDKHQVELARWHATDPAAAVTAAASHGWHLDPDIPAAADQSRWEVHPADLRLVLDVVADQRHHAQERYTSWDMALRDMIVAIPPEGSPGYIPVVEIAKKVGLTRDRVYQIRRQAGNPTP